MVATPHMLHWDCPRPEGVATLAFATRGQEYWKQNGNACSPVSLADRTRATRRASAWGFPWQRRLRRRTARDRSEEHTSELQSLMRNSYAVFCLKKKTTTNHYRA